MLGDPQCDGMKRLKASKGQASTQVELVPFLKKAQERALTTSATM